MAWLHSLELARKLMETDAGPTYWSNMPTVFAFLRLLGMPVMVAYIGHAVVAIAAVAALWKEWRYRDSWPMRSAIFMTSPTSALGTVLSYKADKSAIQELS